MIQGGEWGGPDDGKMQIPVMLLPDTFFPLFLSFHVLQNDKDFEGDEYSIFARICLC